MVSQDAAKNNIIQKKKGRMSDRVEGHVKSRSGMEMERAMWHVLILVSM